MGRLRYEEGSVQPRYDSYCLSNVTSTILSILGVESKRTKLPSDVLDGVDTDGVENVVLFVFDGLGFNEWRRQSNEGLFGKLAERGHTVPITSVFPSTTSTALTTLTTGLTPQEHSLIEWFMYLPEADMIIQTLPFAPMGSSRVPHALSKVDVRGLVTGDPVFPYLSGEGVGVRSYLSRYIAKSAYSQLMHAGSEVHPYADCSDLAVMLRKGLERETRRSLHYVYVSSIDTLEHLYGPNSEESYIEAATVSGALRRGVLDSLDASVAARTLFVITADHGHVSTSPRETTWLDEGDSKLLRSFAKGRSGEPILPWGAPRDVYMRVSDDSLEGVHAYLSERLAGKAMVVKTADAVASGIFGINSPTKQFLERTGNLMVLPFAKRTTWYHHPGVERTELVGQHGGMHTDEMTIPLSIAKASALVG